MPNNTNTTYYFISDIHLTDEKSKRRQHLKDFLHHLQDKPSELYIVGDLFDFWFEYKYVIPRAHFDILCLLNDTVASGCPVHLITGNHDFWVDSFFTAELNIQVHQKPLETNLNGKRIYISHGDGLAKNDTGYRILKRILQNSLNIKLFRLIHPDLGYGMAHFFSNLSRNNSKLKDDSDYTQHAKDKFQEGFDYVILGHTHQPVRIEEKSKVYINTGDWINHYTYAQLENRDLKLRHWQS